MAAKIKRLLAIFIALALIVAAVPRDTLLATDIDDPAADAEETVDAEEPSDAEDSVDEDESSDVVDASDETSADEESSDADDASDEEDEETTVSSSGEDVNDEGEVIQEGATGRIDQSEWITIDDYEKVTESDSYIMYLYEPRLSIMLENKQTGEILESTLSDENDDGNSNSTWNGYMKSGIVLTGISGTINTYQLDLINSECDIDVEMIDNGFSATIFWGGEWQVGLTMNVTLEDDELVVNIPDDSIIEEGDDHYIATISVYPFMGYTFMDDVNGYMLIPDGNGALIYLDNKEGRFTTGFSQLIYGKDEGFVDSGSTESLLMDKYTTVVDANQVIAPVFGMAHTDEGVAYLAIVEEGETRASVEAHPNGAMVNYNRCFAKFLVRDIYVQPLNQSNSGTVTQAESDRTHSERTVRYILLSGDDANYSGMAVAYRNYLLSNDLVKQSDTSYNTRVDFLGTDRESFLFTTTPVVMTTVDDIEEIYGQLQDAGVESVLTVYKGWQKGGIYNTPINRYNAAGKIGGNSALTRLIKNSAADNYNVYLYNNALEINASTNTATFNAVKLINKRTLTIENHKEVYNTFYYMLPTRAGKILSKFVKSYTKKGVNNLAVAGISDTLFSYSQKGNYYTRGDTAAAYDDALSSISESTNLILEQPFEYLWKYTDAFLDMPLGSSDYMYVDENVPFLSMVLKGIMPMYADYVNFEANKSEFFLEMVESGVYPSFYLTYKSSDKLIYTNSSDLYSTEYVNYLDTVIDYDQQLREVASATDGAYIMKHEKLDSGVTRVTYDNGTVIYVNYSDNDVTVDGYTVEAMSYKVGEAK